MGLGSRSSGLVSGCFGSSGIKAMVCRVRGATGVGSHDEV